MKKGSKCEKETNHWDVISLPRSVNLWKEDEDKPRKICKWIPNKKISNNEPLERRTEFERKKKMLSKRRPPDNLWRENLYEIKEIWESREMS